MTATARRSTGRAARMLLFLIALAVSPFMSPAPDPAAAQANTAAINITTAFVTPSGQATIAPSGSAAGISFTFTPTLAGQPAVVLTTNSAGQAFGALAAGSYIFQESAPAPGTAFLSASMSQAGGQGQPLAPGSVVVFTPGASYAIAVTNTVTGQSLGGTATLTIYKSLATGTGQPAVGSLAGYAFTLSGQNGLPTQVQFTNQLGQATFSGLPAGVYALSEAPTPGATFASMAINGVPAQQQQTFQVQAGGDYEVEVTNLVSGSGTVSVQVQLLDPGGQLVGAGDLGGYTFTLTPQNGAGVATTISSTSTGIATANLPPGAYSISESPMPGVTPVSYTIDGYPSQSGQFTVGLGQTTSIIATYRVTGATPEASATRSVSLQTGCNNVVSTFPDGSTGPVVAAGVAPAANLAAIWKFDNATQTFHAVYFAPSPSGVQPPVDIASVSRLDPLFLCVTAPATLTEPAA